MDNNNGSGVNTILLVVILVVIVGGLVWFFAGVSEEQPADGLNVDVNLPVKGEAE